MIKVILDTNFLIYCAKEKLDYKEEIEKILNQGYQLVVPMQVVAELKRVSEKKKEKIPLEKRKPKYRRTTGKDKVAANLALTLLKHNNIKLIEAIGKTPDSAIINYSKENSGSIVATLDKEMRTKLERVILISKGNKLILTN